MALTLTEIDPVKVLASGGDLISIYGDFSGKTGVGFHVYAGPTGDATDAPCSSGVPSRGAIIYPLSETEMRCYVPVLDVASSPHDIYMVSLAEPLDNDVLAGVLTVLPAQYYSRVFDMRSVFPPYYRAGARNMGALEQLP